MPVANVCHAYLLSERPLTVFSLPERTAERKSKKKAPQYYASAGYGYIVFTGERIKTKYMETIRVISPPEIRSKWPTIDPFFLVELENYGGPTRVKMEEDKFSELIHLHGRPCKWT